MATNAAPAQGQTSNIVDKAISLLQSAKAPATGQPTQTSTTAQPAPVQDVVKQQQTLDAQISKMQATPNLAPDQQAILDRLKTQRTALTQAPGTQPAPVTPTPAVPTPTPTPTAKPPLEFGARVTEKAAELLPKAPTTVTPTKEPVTTGFPIDQRISGLEAQGTLTPDQEAIYNRLKAKQTATAPFSDAIVKKTTDQNTINNGLVDIKNNTSIDEFLNTTLNSFSKLAEDFSTIVSAKITQLDASSKAEIDNLNRRSALLDEYARTTIQDLETAKEHAYDIATQDRDNTLKVNELQASITEGDYTDKIALTEDNNARYLGYLKGKFEAAGMLDSGAGLMAIGKYAAASQMSLNTLYRDQANARLAFAGQTQKILTDYSRQVWQVEADTKKQESDIFFQAQDKILQIESDITKSETNKQSQTLALLSESAKQQATLKQQAFNDITTIKQLKIQEMEYQHKVLMDTLQQQNWEKDFGLKSDEFDLTKWKTEFDTVLDTAKFNEGARQFEETMKDKKTQDVLDNLYREKTLEYQQDVLKQDQDQFEAKSEQDQIQFEAGQNANERQRGYEIAKYQVDNGYADADILKMYENGGVLAAGMDYVPAQDPSKTFNLGQKLIQMKDAVAGGLKIAGQCVGWTRSFLPDLPYGLTTLSDKIRNLDASNWAKTTIPQAAEAVVLDLRKTGEKGLPDDEVYGHIAPIFGVDYKNRTFMTEDYNIKTGKNTTNTWSFDDPRIRGFYKSPNIGKETVTDKAITPIKDPVKKANMEMKLASTFDSYTKNMRDVQRNVNIINSGYEEALASSNNGKSLNAPSQAVLVTFQKMLDPTSVVRETEYARSGEGQSLKNQLLGQYQKLVQGGAGVTIDDLNNFKNLSNKLLEGYNSTLIDAARRTQNQAISYGLNLENILTPESIEVLREWETKQTTVTSTSQASTILENLKNKLKQLK